jgi:chorismate mutase
VETPVTPIAQRRARAKNPGLRRLLRTLVTNANIERSRQKLDKVDDQIIELLQRRVKISKKIQKAKAEAGLSRVDVSRENGIRDKYLKAHGWNGASIAASILRMVKER